MRVALDTNRYVDLCKGVAETVALLEDAEAIVLPFVVLGELRAGFAHARRQAACPWRPTPQARSRRLT